jgi:hypothetical protein
MVLVIDGRAAIQESHTAQGILMFLVGTVALSLVDRTLLRLLRPKANALPTAEAHRAARVDDWRGGGVVAAALMVMAAAALGLPGLRSSVPALEPPPELPRQLAGWSVREAPEAGHFLGSVHFTQRSSLVYERDNQSIVAFLGWDDRQLRVGSLLSDKNAVRGWGWTIEQRDHVPIEPGKVGMERVVARRFAERSVTLHAYRGTAGVFVETLRGALALDRPGSPFARPGRAGLLRVSTLVQPGPEGVREAEQALRGFLAELAPTLAW